MEKIKIADAHNDFLTGIENEKEILKYMAELESSPLKILSCAVWTTEMQTPLRELKQKEIFIKKTGKSLKFLLSIEDLFFADQDNIKEIIELKPVSCTLTWNNDNKLAGGCNGGNNGLTNLGKQIVKELEKNNILIDTAHLSRKAFFEFADFTTKPLYNSHSCIDMIKNHNRNLTDRQIDMVVKTDGFLGICFVPNFLSDKAEFNDGAVSKNVSFKDAALHIDYVIRNFGYKNVGLGSDFYGVSQLPQGLADYNKLDNLFKELKNLGHSDEVIEAVAFKNYENFLRRNQ